MELVILIIVLLVIGSLIPEPPNSPSPVRKPTSSVDWETYEKPDWFSNDRRGCSRRLSSRYS